MIDKEKINEMLKDILHDFGYDDLFINVNYEEINKNLEEMLSTIDEEYRNDEDIINLCLSTILTIFVYQNFNVPEKHAKELEKKCFEKIDSIIDLYKIN